MLCATIALRADTGRAAPGGSCRSARRLAQLGAAAESALASGRQGDAWRSIRDAVQLARRSGCSNHRSLGRAYLVLGIIQHRRGQYTRMYSSWQRALRLDRRLALDARFTNTRLRTAFRKLKRRLYPPKARPRPTPPPRRRRVTQPSPDEPAPAEPRARPRPEPAPRRVRRPARTPTPNPYAAYPARGGCSTDRDCKGDRICHRGACTYPKRRQQRSSPDSGGSQVVAVVVPQPVHSKAARQGGRRYSEQGGLELGLGISFQWSSATAEDEYGSITIDQLYFGLDLYLGYFVANRFKLGFYFSVPITKSKVEGSGDDSLSWEVDLIAAPGFAWPFGGVVYGFVDFLIGFGALGGDAAVGHDDNVLGLVGGELGLKFAVSKHLIMKFAFKPVYLFGKVESDYDEIKVGNVRIILALGFSGFW